MDHHQRGGLFAGIVAEVGGTRVAVGRPALLGREGLAAPEDALRLVAPLRVLAPLRLHQARWRQDRTCPCRGPAQGSCV